MKVIVRRILKDIEAAMDEAERDRKSSTNCEGHACNITRKQLLANAHIMVCNAFDERSKFDE